MAAYYNEIEPYAAQTLRNLIVARHIAPGDVDERSIEDVNPGDLRGYTQCHFFAGIGVWSHALRIAGWPDDREVWTGSCPCQPFSSAGKGGGFADERHLWPAWHWLIGERRPAVVFGEQVASKDGLAWLDLVHADLEAESYAVGAFDLCAAGVGAPHIRQRLYFVADCQEHGWYEGRRAFEEWAGFGDDGSARELAHSSSSPGLEGCDKRALGSERAALERSCGAGALADKHGTRQRGLGRGGLCGVGASGTFIDDCGPTNGFWNPADWLPCRDGKARPVEPGTFPLAHGAPARVGRLRAYGNAIVAPLAAEFIRAYLDCRP